MTWAQTGPWAQWALGPMGPGPNGPWAKRAMVPNGPWAQTGPGPKQALGPNGPGQMGRAGPGQIVYFIRTHTRL